MHNQSEEPTKSFARTLPPAGCHPSAGSVLSAYRLLQGRNEQNIVARAELFLESELKAKKITFSRSGTHAIASVLKHLRATAGVEAVCLAGYNCPDIVTACFAAGLRVIPCDVDERTLLPKIADVPTDKRLVFLASNLYGLPDRLHPELVCVDDACQAALSSRQGVPVGRTPNVYGVLSFSRGKAFCGTGGGAVVANEGTAPLGESASASTDRKYNFKGFLEWVGARTFERPSLYGVPSGMKFLNLGQTTFEPELASDELSAAAVVVACAAVLEAAQEAEIRRSGALRWTEGLRRLNVVLPFLERGGEMDAGIIPLRYPVLFKTNLQRDRALAVLSAEGLGASPSYKRELAHYAGHDERFISRDLPGVVGIADRLMTLPVHKYLEPRDVTRGAEVISQIIQKA